MTGLTSPIKDVIKLIFVGYLILQSVSLCAQSTGPGIFGSSFIALNVSNADTAAGWYEEMFGLKLIKEIKLEDGSAHIRIEGNEFLIVEIIQVKGSKTITDCELQKGESHLLSGFFKAGIFVRDVQQTEDYFKAKGVAISNSIFIDKETATMSFVLADPYGNLLQFIERDTKSAK